eukprot:576838-Pleurochrysis_carterae.AAC.1
MSKLEQPRGWKARAKAVEGNVACKLRLSRAIGRGGVGPRRGAAVAQRAKHVHENWYLNHTDRSTEPNKTKTYK